MTDRGEPYAVKVARTVRRGLSGSAYGGNLFTGLGLLPYQLIEL